MQLPGLDGALWIASILGEALLFIVLLRRRSYQAFPIFTAFIAYSLLSDPLLFLAHPHLSRNAYFNAFLIDSLIQVLFQLGILFEISANVLNPVKRSLPKGALLVFTGMLVSGTLVTFLLASHATQADLSTLALIFIKASFVFAILRLVIFSAIALFAQALGIGWKNHVLQLASGLALYSVIMLLVQMLHRFLGVTDKYEYHVLEQIRVAAWVFALGYWSYAFSRQEAPRKEFSPQMARFLISISGSAKRDRAVLARLKND